MKKEIVVKYLKRITILLSAFILLLSACKANESLPDKSATSEASAPTIWDTEPTTLLTPTMPPTSPTLPALPTPNTLPISPPPTPSAAPPSQNDMGAPGQFIVPPDLPLTALSTGMFTPVGWFLMDYVETDYNGDGNMDIIGVLENENAEISYGLPGWDDAPRYPRILFATYSNDDGSYNLDFQDANLIRTRFEGGTFGDPYEPLTAKGNVFTITAFGGSSWKWKEASTFRYMNGGWYLIYDEERGTLGPISVSYFYNDYDSGVGFRGYNDTTLFDGTPSSSCLPLFLVKDGQVLPEYAELNGTIRQLAGNWNGVDSEDHRGSNISVTPLFDDIAYVEVSAFRATAVGGANLGGFAGLAVLKNGGLNFQTSDKTYIGDETIVFRLRPGRNGHMFLYSNDYAYSCGWNVYYDSAYSRS